MKVLNLTAHNKIYTSNVYLVTGTWNRLNDVNTLIDVGRDPGDIETLWQRASTGVGKPKVEQDRAGKYGPRIAENRVSNVFVRVPVPKIDSTVRIYNMEGS